VIGAEALEVGQVAGPSPLVDGEDETRPVRVAADPGGGLDILGGVLGLPGDQHQPQAGDVDTNLEHAGCQQHIHGKGHAVGTTGGQLGASACLGAE
jgi:hypothetical protein